MNFSDYISKVKYLKPGTEGNIKVQREEVINSFRTILKELTKVGNTLTTDFVTGTLRKTGYACYDLINTIRDMDSLVKNTVYFDYSNKGLCNYFNDKLKGLKFFKKTLSTEHIRDHKGGEEIFAIIELKPPYDELEVVKKIKETLGTFEYCHRDHNYKYEKGKNTMKIEIYFTNCGKLRL